MVDGVVVVELEEDEVLGVVDVDVDELSLEDDVEPLEVELSDDVAAVPDDDFDPEPRLSVL